MVRRRTSPGWRRLSGLGAFGSPRRARRRVPIARAVVVAPSGSCSVVGPGIHAPVSGNQGQPMNVSAGSVRDLRPCIWPADLVIVLVAKADVGAGGSDFGRQLYGEAGDDLRAPL